MPRISVISPTSLADVSLARRLLGCEPRIGFEAGLPEGDRVDRRAEGGA